MKRLLCIVSSMDRGGAETFLMKVYRKIDRTKYQFDFCVSKSQKGFYDEEIEKMGGRIFVIPPKSKNPFKSFFSIKKIVEEHKYQYVLRTSQQSLASIDLLAAKLGGANRLIYRSSNAGLTGSKLKKVLNRVFGFLPKIIPNVKIAPSTEAAMFVFGKSATKMGIVKIVHNGLDYNIFKFDPQVHNDMKKMLHIDDNIILFGHIGRFETQKNHHFLIEVFNEIYRKNKNARFLIIGEGTKELEIKNQIKALGLADVIIVLPPTNDISKYLMAMDMLIFPSYFEGMPNVIIEAEATGLRCVVSDKITKEADITGLLEYKSLEETAQSWAEKALSMIKYERKNQLANFQKNNYLITDVANEFTHLIFNSK